MARNRIAEAFVEVKTRGIERARLAFGKFGRDAEKDAKKVGAGIGGALGAAEKFQSVLSKVLIPVSVVASVAGLARSFRQAGKDAETWEKNLRAVVDTANKAAVSTRQQINGLSEFEQMQAESLERFNKAQQEIKDSIADVDSENLLQQLQRWSFSLFVDAPVTSVERVAAAEGELNRLTNARNSEMQELAKLGEKLLANAEKQADAQARILRLEAEGDDAGIAAFRIQEQINEKLVQLDAARRREQSALAASLLEQVVALDEIKAKTIQRFRDEAEAKKRAEKEKADAEIAERQRVAQQTASSNISAIQATTQAQADAARQIADLASSLSTLPTLISSLEGEVREIRGRLP